MQFYTVFVALVCLAALTTEAKSARDEQSGQKQRKRFEIPYKPTNAEQKKQYYWTTEGYDPNDPYTYLGDDIISRIIIDLETELRTQLCMNFSSDFPLGYQCGDFCMSAELICDSLYDCFYYFDDESEVACQARRDVESIFEFCKDVSIDCYEDDYAYDCTTYYDSQTGMSFYEPIYWSQICDGYLDCVDGSDEHGCDEPVDITTLPSPTEPTVDPTIVEALGKYGLAICQDHGTIIGMGCAGSLNICITAENLCDGHRDCSWDHPLLFNDEDPELCQEVTNGF